MARSKSRPGRTRNELDTLMSWLSKLRVAGKSRVVIVEKKRAAEILRFLGVPNVYSFSGMQDYVLVDLLMDLKRECIVLFDVSHSSNRRAEHLVSLLRQYGVKVNTRFRKVLLSSELRSLSGVLTYLKKHVNTSDRLSVARSVLR